MPTQTEIVIRGTLGGNIWMPSCTCAKTFKYSSRDHSFSVNRYSDGSKPTLREIVLELTNDGDFQSASIADATVTITRTQLEGQTSVRRSRDWDIRRFTSIADCVVEEESEEYYAILDCFADVE